MANNAPSHRTNRHKPQTKKRHKQKRGTNKKRGGPSRHKTGRALPPTKRRRPFSPQKGKGLTPSLLHKKGRGTHLPKKAGTSQKGEHPIMGGGAPPPKKREGHPLSPKWRGNPPKGRERAPPPQKGGEQPPKRGQTDRVATPCMNARTGEGAGWRRRKRMARNCCCSNPVTLQVGHALNARPALDPLFDFTRGLARLLHSREHELVQPPHFDSGGCFVLPTPLWIPGLKTGQGRELLDVPPLQARSMRVGPILWRVTHLLAASRTSLRRGVTGLPVPLLEKSRCHFWIAPMNHGQTVSPTADPLMRVALVKPMPPNRRGRVANSRTASVH